MIIFLRKDGEDLTGSDQIMWVDGRKSLSSVIEEVKMRNRMYQRNFPHKIADQFLWKGRIIDVK